MVTERLLRDGITSSVTASGSQRERHSIICSNQFNANIANFARVYRWIKVAPVLHTVRAAGRLLPMRGVSTINGPQGRGCAPFHRRHLDVHAMS